MRPAPTASTGAAESRSLRLLTVLVAVTTLLGATATSFATGPTSLALGGAGGVALLVATLVLLSAGTTAAWVGLPTLRALAGAGAGCWIALLAIVFLQALVVGPRSFELPWFLAVSAACATAALVAWGGTAAWLVAALATGLVQAARIAIAGDAQDAIASDVFSTFASVATLLLAQGLLAASRAQDALAAETAAATARRSADEARAAAEDRTRLLVHDELLATLGLAARGPAVLGDRLAAQAVRARRMLAELGAPRNAGDLPAHALAELLRRVPAEEAPHAEVRVRVDRGALVVDAEAVDALTGAARQALVNAARHAGPGAHLALDVTADRAGIRVVVADDGVGFDPAAVPPTRMGVASSIRGRMEALSGGEVEVASSPGSGTRVELRWRPERGAPADEPAPATDTTLVGTPDARRQRWFAIAISAFFVAQLVLAVLATGRGGPPWLEALALTGVAGGLLAAGLPRGSRLGSPAWLAVAAVAATTALSLVPASRDPERYGDVWFIAATGFVLLVVAARGRPGVALVGAALATAIAFGGAAAQRSDVPDVVAATVRMDVVVVIGAGFAIGTARVRRRTDALRAEELVAVRASAFREAERTELAGRSAELEGLIGDVLDRLAADAPDDILRTRCAALEGALRDSYRAGRLAREPLTASAARARTRGVDVALFDGSPEHELDEQELDRIARWMAERLDAVGAGRFTGRIQPPGRGVTATAATDDEVDELAAHR